MKISQSVKKFGRALSAGAVTAFATVNAHAALPAAVGTSLTLLETDAASLITLLYGTMISVVGGFVIFGLVKKGMRKAV